MTFRTIHTLAGLAAMAAAEATGTPINLTHMAVGDGNGNPVEPTEAQTDLVRETFRATINRVSASPTEPNRFTVEMVIPATAGGFTMREVGVFTADGTLFAVGNLPETYKPQIAEGAFADTGVRVEFVVTNAEVVTLQVDPNITLATQQWVSNNVHGIHYMNQNAFEGVISNFPNGVISTLLHLAIFPTGRPYVVPSDRLGHEVAKRLIEPSATRDRLTAGMFISARDGDPVRTLELALQAVIDADSIEAKLRAGAKAGSYAGRTADERLAAATEAGVITPAEAQRVRRARALVAEVIRVDDFAQDLGAAEMRPPRPEPGPEESPNPAAAGPRPTPLERTRSSAAGSAGPAEAQDATSGRRRAIA